MQRLLFHPIVRESISSINAFTILGASVPMDGESSLNSVKTGGGEKDQQLVYFSLHSVHSPYSQAYFFFYKFKIFVHFNDFVRGDW